MPARKTRRTSQDFVSMTDLLSPVAKELCRVREHLDRSLGTPHWAINKLLETIGAGQGKMLRPAFVLLAGRACGRIRPQHIRLAAMIEMIHTATLLHDDVIDQASLRRNRPTANCLHGNTGAVLLGDFLLSRAFEVGAAMNMPHVQKTLIQTSQQICQGELLQNIRRDDWTITEAEYLEIIEFKTAGLFSTACRLGARLSGAGSAIERRFVEYGRCIGIAFQITDDILDIAGDDEKIGKTLGTDAAQKKPTLPLIHYLKQQPPAKRKAFIKTLSAEPDARQWIQILNRSGSLDYARQTATHFAHKAIQSIPAGCGGPALESLKQIAATIAGRA
jgi:octaprenyl-diphosphate synthase